MEHLPIIATLFLILFAGIAGIDGIYYHLWKYRLYARRESLYEHLLHTIRAFLFIPIVFLLFVHHYAGYLLWLALFIIAVDLVVEMLDVLCERASREEIGGLFPLEYAAHISATTTRIIAISFILAYKPLSAWSFSSPSLLEPDYPGWIQFVAINLIGGNILIGFVHLWFLQKKYRLS